MASPTSASMSACQTPAASANTMLATPPSVVLVSSTRAPGTLLPSRCELPLPPGPACGGATLATTGAAGALPPTGGATTSKSSTLAGSATRLVLPSVFVAAIVSEWDPGASAAVSTLKGSLPVAKGLPELPSRKISIDAMPKGSSAPGSTANSAPCT